MDGEETFLFLGAGELKHLTGMNIPYFTFHTFCSTGGGGGGGWPDKAGLVSHKVIGQSVSIGLRLTYKCFHDSKAFMYRFREWEVTNR